ncbi:MAG: prepilin-type N-terminal cleavage/methylation domain-containing protein [Deltaproteobacteria bacterium]|nr:prepilin-type N-terminal cleavage/methylation domain-containing protein [Deltaproteobacteria bacterium]
MPIESTTRSLFGLAQKRGCATPKVNIFGFTLIEVMISVCIIGVLSAISTPFYLGYREKARMTVAIADMKHIEVAIVNFVANNASLPDTLGQIGMENILDPWGRPFVYLRIDGGPPASMGQRRKDHFMVPVNTDFDLYSQGPDGASRPPFTAKDSRDDIVRAFDGGYYGKVSDM